jgi:hypothetical protein
MAATITMESGQATTGVVRLRALGVVAATLAAVAVWTLASPVLGAQLIVRFGTGTPQTIGVGLVAGASLIASLLAWSLLVMLERRTSRARTIWTGVAITVLLVSFSLPASAGTTLSTKAALAAMHIAVAAVLIPTLRRSAAAR